MVAQAIDALSYALEDERRALASNDAEALLDANRAKLSALQVLEGNPPPPESHQRLRELMDLNRANGNLLARRQREVRWALRHLGRTETASGYARDGRLSSVASGRALGIG
ncbi:flagellar protein FlgN [Pseudomarimonas salicorniae]|uniref:Flagellar protein FlgN n=1 Tax=Pseudomarimonas salicorniae TaxID=2933270 RepID=A0ABT0GKU7_9GAMM|nr:flagellar protein FlgN [Lysobacter sp. CAU 1642]MCK7595175.1 flagellar protein FlgN [Lysobacter sp. CAU 1642]